MMCRTNSFQIQKMLCSVLYELGYFSRTPFEMNVVSLLGEDSYNYVINIISPYR